MASPPELPPREVTTQPVESVPELPDRTVPVKPLVIDGSSFTTHLPLHYNLDDDVSTICVSRQLELYLSPAMNENSDIFNTSDSFHSLVTKKLEGLGLGNNNQEEGDQLEEIKFWLDYINDFDEKLVRDHHVDQLEQAIETGIPDSLRGLVYLKTLRTKATITKETYAKLLKKTEASDTIKNQNSFYENISADLNLKELLKIFNYYTAEVAIPTAIPNLGLDNKNMNLDILYESSQHLPPNDFIYNVSKIITSPNVPGLTSEETFVLLLKFNHIFHALIKDEFLYKVLRALETLVPQEFHHISTQGIQLTLLHKRFLVGLFGEIKNPKVVVEILDFLVFEGFDFILRLIVAIYLMNSSKIMALECDELSNFLNGSDFFTILNNEEESKFKLTSVLQFQPQIIRFENEYHLINANSMTRHRNELLNLQEVNEDLENKIREIKNLLRNLSLTHKEILDQSDSFKKQLEDAQTENERLVKVRDDIKEQYENLSMKENVQNTINANEEFAQRNKELEEQIVQLKESIAKKKSKIEKMA